MAVKHTSRGGPTSLLCEHGRSSVNHSSDRGRERLFKQAFMDYLVGIWGSDGVVSGNRMASLGRRELYFWDLAVSPRLDLKE